MGFSPEHLVFLRLHREVGVRSKAGHAKGGSVYLQLAHACRILRIPPAWRGSAEISILTNGPCCSLIQAGVLLNPRGFLSPVHSSEYKET